MPATPPIHSTRPSAMRHVARIDVGALQRNLLSLGSGTLVDLSGDGYGHGAVLVATAARDAGAQTFGVRTASESAALAAHGIEARLLDASELESRETEALYGVDLEPVMRVSARVISTKTIPTGDGVSYGYTWRATRPTALALVPLGYADGIFRAAGNSAFLLLAGRLRPIVGRVAMDVCVVEIGAADTVDEVAVGSEAVLFGDTSVPGVSLADWAARLDLPPLSVTAGIGSRVPRISA